MQLIALCRRRLSPALLAALTLALAGCGSQGGGGVPPAKGPNVVVVMTDDQDAASTAVMSELRRQVARRGVRFVNSFVTTSECCPSRATFLTGQYAHNHGVLSSQPPDGGYAKFTDRENTLPVWLRDAGYATAYFGKYLNGYGIAEDGSPPTEVPAGWDEWHVPVEHTEYQMYGYTLNENGELVHYGHAPADYETDVLARKSAAYIRDAAGGDRPFFLTVAPLAPHGEGSLEDRPHVTRDPRPAPRDRGSLEGAPVPRPPSYDEADLSDKPAATRERAHRTVQALDDGTIEAEFRGRQESLLAVDDLVGRLVRTLRASGEVDDTYLIFTSDNGFMLGEHRLTGKDFPYEESVRVPLIVSGPGIPHGERQTDLVANIDLAPTIVDIADASAGRVMDGTSVVPVAAGKESPERDLLLEFLSGPYAYSAIRADHWMLASYDEGDSELYDLRNDPYELDNVFDDPAYADVQDRLERELRRLRDCEGAACR